MPELFCHVVGPSVTTDTESRRWCQNSQVSLTLGLQVYVLGRKFTFANCEWNGTWLVVWTDSICPYDSACPFLSIVDVDVLRFNGLLKLPAQVSLIGFVKGALSDLCLSWTGPWFTASSPECHYPICGISWGAHCLPLHNQSSVSVRGFRFLWLSLPIQWQQGMQQPGNLTAGIGKETRRQNKSKFGLCTDKLQPASSDKILWAQMRDGPVFWAKKCEIWTRWMSVSQDSTSAYMLCFVNPSALQRSWAYSSQCRSIFTFSYWFEIRLALLGYWITLFLLESISHW